MEDEQPDDMDSVEPPFVARAKPEYGVGAPHPVLTVASFILFPIVGAILGLLAMLAMESYIDSRIPVGTPVRPHAAEGFFVTMPICGFLGCSIGLALAFGVAKLRMASTAILLLASILGWIQTSASWKHYVATNGPDVSEQLLFYPPMTLVAITCFIGGSIGTLILLRLVSTREKEIV